MDEKSVFIYLYHFAFEFLVHRFMLQNLEIHHLLSPVSQNVLDY